jgi:LysM repeat protein
MTSSSLTLALIVLLVILSPAAARTQEQDQPNLTPQEKPAEEQVKEPPETAPAAQQSGTLLIPQEGKAQPEAEEPKSTMEKETPGSYIIKQGDTLWDISNTFLRDPFLWPFLWKANPYVTDADLIYPGQTLIIPSMAPIERAMESAGEQEQLIEKAAAPRDSGPERAFGKTPMQPPAAAPEEVRASRLVLPEDAPVPIIDKYSMLNAGFVSQEESRDRIVGSLENKTIFGYDDIVYVSIRSKEPSVGDRFIIYQPLDILKHPVTGRNSGRFIKVLGLLHLT